MERALKVAAITGLLGVRALCAVASAQERVDCGVSGNGEGASGFYHGRDWPSLADDVVAFGFGTSRTDALYPGSWSVTVDWGEGSSETHDVPSEQAGAPDPPDGRSHPQNWIAHTYSAPGSYIVHVTAAGTVNTVSDGSGQDIPCTTDFLSTIVIRSAGSGGSDATGPAITAAPPPTLSLGASPPDGNAIAAPKRPVNSENDDSGGITMLATGGVIIVTIGGMTYYYRRRRDGQVEELARTPSAEAVADAAADAVTGFADGATLGGAKWLREQIPDDIRQGHVADEDSIAYRAGDIASNAVPLPTGVAKAADKAADTVKYVDEVMDTNRINPRTGRPMPDGAESGHMNVGGSPPPRDSSGPPPKQFDPDSLENQLNRQDDAVIDEQAKRAQDQLNEEAAKERDRLKGLDDLYRQLDEDA